MTTPQTRVTRAGLAQLPGPAATTPPGGGGRGQAAGAADPAAWPQTGAGPVGHGDGAEVGAPQTRVQYAPHECACGCGERPRNWKAKYIAGHRPPKSLADRLWRRCKRMSNGCLEWQGFCHPTRGYGQIGRGRRDEGLVETHRAAWEVTYGPIPEGMFVCHRCDNPPCCDPSHLFLGTQAENVTDMITKGRQAKGDALPHTKLSAEQVATIRARYNPRFGPPKRGGCRSNALELAAEFGVTQSYVMQLVHGHFRSTP